MAKEMIVKRDKRGRWVKGSSGNPKGRPLKPFAITNEVKKIMQMKEPVTKKPYLELFAQSVLTRAIEGDPTCTKLVFQYVDGLPVQNIDVNETGEKKIEVVFTKKQ